MPDSAAQHVVSLGPISIDLYRHRCMFGKVEVKLTPTQFKILLFLLRKPGQVFSRRRILNEVDSGAIVEDRTADVHIKCIRSLLAKAAAAAGCPSYGEIIETVRGVGYRMKEVLLPLES